MAVLTTILSAGYAFRSRLERDEHPSIVSRPAFAHTPPAMSHGNAVYLVGHGPYRNPRFLELQYFRILRYRRCLAARQQGPLPEPAVYTDLNIPRSNDPAKDIGGFPSFLQLYEAVSVGVIELVFLDLKLGTPVQPSKFAVIPEMLRSAGAQVLNAYYDDEDVLLGAVARQAGETEENCRRHLPGDSSDVVALFPALAADVGTRVAGVNPRSAALSRQNPYSAGRIPFVEDALLRNIDDLRQERLEQDRQLRRGTETLYCMGPAHAGMLLDELPPGSTARTPQELRWAEARLRDLRFEKIARGARLSYERTVDEYRVFADIRANRELKFHLYRNGTGPSVASVGVPDKWTRDLMKKFLRLVRHAGTRVTPDNGIRRVTQANVAAANVK